MGIAARLATIPQLLLNIENEKRELQQILDVIHDPTCLTVIHHPLFLSYVDPEVWIHNPVFSIENTEVLFNIMQSDVRNRIRTLEMRKRALLEEQQSLIVRAALRGDRRNSNRKR